MCPERIENPQSSSPQGSDITRFCPILECNNRRGSVPSRGHRHHVPNEPNRKLYSCKESGKGQSETPCDDLQINGGDVRFSVLHIRQISSIQPESLCHLNLRPASSLSKLFQSPPNPDADVLGHNIPSWLEDSVPQTGYIPH